MLLLKKKTFELETSSPVVTAAEAATVAEVETILAAAEAECAEMKRAAQVAYEEEKKRGYADGIQAGKEEMLLQKLNLLDESVRYMESVEDKVAEIVIKALKKCVAEIGDKELVVQIVKKAMQVVVRNQRQITVKVHSDMVPVIKSRVDSLLAEFPALTFIEVVEDAHLAQTACVVETEAGLVEASVDGQINAIEKSIRANFAKGK